MGEEGGEGVDVRSVAGRKNEFIEHPSCLPGLSLCDIPSV